MKQYFNSIFKTPLIVQLLPPPGGGGVCNELSIRVHGCRDLQSSTGSQQPSPYVVYRFFDFPDHPTATVHDCCNPRLDDLQSYCVSMDAELHQYLRSEVLQLYVFDYREERMDTYVGKTRVSLLSLAQDEDITGEGLLGLCLCWVWLRTVTSQDKNITIIPQQLDYSSFVRLFPGLYQRL